MAKIGVLQTYIKSIWSSLKESFQFQNPFFFLFICSTTKERWLSGLTRERSLSRPELRFCCHLSSTYLELLPEKKISNIGGFLSPSYRGMYPDMKTTFHMSHPQCIVHLTIEEWEKDLGIWDQLMLDVARKMLGNNHGYWK